MSNILRVPTMQSSLSEWLCYIECLSSMSIDFNLEKIRDIAVFLDLINFTSYVILVGGTNGKGTTCCLLENIFLNSGLTVGLYISPHLLHYNERIRVCGKELPDSMHIHALSIIESVRSSLILTYFEFSTLSALYIFKELKLDVLILEVGLGGRLDATNIVNADISVITSIGIDHTDYLGSDRNIIAKEKSGIFKSGKLAVIGEIDRPSIVDEMAKYYGTKLFAVGQHWNFQLFENSWSWWDYNYDMFLSELPFPLIPLANAATALGVLCCSPFLISRTAISYGLRVANLPGRFQIINYKPLIILDVGHNPHAANYVVKRLSSLILQLGCIRIVIGMLNRKDVKNTISCLKNVVNVWYCACLNTPLSVSSNQWSDYLQNYTDDVYFFDSVLNAWNKAILDANINDCVIAFGSFYTVGPIIKKMFL